jgi:hypothetical protein
MTYPQVIDASQEKKGAVEIVARENFKVRIEREQGTREIEP